MSSILNSTALDSLGYSCEVTADAESYDSIVSRVFIWVETFDKTLYKNWRTSSGSLMPYSSYYE